MSEATYLTGSYVRLTATGNAAPVPKNINGFYVNNTTAGTIQFYDSATTTTTTPITGLITPAIGWNPLPVYATAGVYVVIGGTALDVTLSLA